MLSVSARLPIVALSIALLASVAQSAAAADGAPSGMRLVTLGTQGGPRINPNRAQPANLVTVNGTHYLVDAGNGVARQLTLAKVPFAAVGRIFITHNHDDHDADWGTLMGLEWSLGRSTPIDVYGPRGTEQMLLGFLQYFSTNLANRTFRKARRPPPEEVFRAHDVQQDGLVYEDANVKVTALENCHYHYAEGQPGHGWQKSYALRFQAGKQSVVFSGDTGDCGNRLVEFARGATWLVHEVIDLKSIEQQIRNDKSTDFRPDQIPELMQHMRDEHTSPEDIGRLAAAAGVDQVVLTHLVPGTDDLPDSTYADGVKQHYKGPVVVAHDLQVFE